MRASQQAGVDYLHRAVVSRTGVVQNDARVRLDEPLPHGSIYAHGALLRATDGGLAQERNGVTKNIFSDKGGDSKAETFCMNIKAA